METSQTLKALAESFCKLQGELNNAPKNAENPFFKSKYADLTCIIDTAKPVLVKYGFSITQGLSSEGKTAIISTMLLHSSGEYIKDVLKLEAKDSSPQALGSAFSYGRRYAYSSIIGMATEDDDGNENHQNSSKNSQGQDEKNNANKDKKEPKKISQNPKIEEIKGEVSKTLSELGVSKEDQKTDIMKTQKILKISGSLETWTEKEWAYLSEYYSELLQEKLRKEKGK